MFSVLVLVVLVLGRNPTKKKQKNISFSESLGDKMASECFTIVDDVVVVVLDWKFYLNFFFLKIFEFYFFFSKNKYKKKLFTEIKLSKIRK